MQPTKFKLFNLRPIPTMLLFAIVSIVLAALTNVWIWASSLLLLILLTMLARFNGTFKKYFIKLIICCLTFTIVGLCMFGEEYRYSNINAQGIVNLQGEVSMSSTIDPNGKVVEKDNKYIVILDNLKIDNNKLKGKAKVTVDQEVLSQLAVGDHLVVKVTIAKLPLNLSDSMSVSKYQDKIYWNAVIVDQDNNARSYQITHDKPSFIDSIKLFQKRTLDKSCNPTVASFLYAMTFGDSSGMSYEIKDDFAATGTAHLFAVSGLHVGILAASILFLLKKFKCSHLWSTCITIASLIFYCILADFSMSVIRATLMISLGLIATDIGARNDMLSTISFSAIIMLLVVPSAIFDLGFQMSYFAVFGIALTMPPLLRILNKRLPNKISQPLAVCLAANIGLLPIMLIYFNKLSLIFVLANLLVVPLVSALFPIYLLFSIIGAIPYMNFLLAFIGFIFEGIITLIQVLAQLQFLKISIALPWLVIIPHCLFLVFVSDYCFLERKPKIVMAITACVVVTCCTIFSMRGVLFPQDKIYCINDSDDNGYITFQTQDSGNYLVLNGQATFDGIMQLSKLYEHNNIEKLDGVILCQDQTDTKYLGEFMLKYQTSTIYARRYGADFSNYVKQYSNSKLDGDHLTISFLDEQVANIILSDINIYIYPKGVVGYQAIYCDILIGNNQNDSSVVSKHVTENKKIVDNEKYISWGCVFTLKNDRIKVID